LNVLEEISEILQNASIAVDGTTMFRGTKASIPSTSDAILSLRASSGPPPLKTHDLNTPWLVRPNVQLMARAEDSEDARRMVWAAYDVLLPFQNTVVGAFTSRAVTSITRTGSTATATVPVAHGLFSGKLIEIAGADLAAYNGSVRITRLTALTFSYIVAGAPASPATGTITYSSLGVFYRNIQVLQQPFDIGLDANGKSQWAFNITTVKAPS
jgi:hypothetical protein